MPYLCHFERLAPAGCLVKSVGLTLAPGGDLCIFELQGMTVAIGVQNLS